METSSQQALQSKIKELESQLADMKSKLETSGVELEANEAILQLAMQDMRKIYDDLIRSQTQLAQSDKLATIGLLTAGIVHEINNPLAALRLLFSLFEEQALVLEKIVADNQKPGAQSFLKDYKDFVRNGKSCAETITRIVNDIRMFSRSDKGIRNKENITRVMDSVIGIVWNSVRNKIIIKKEYGPIPDIYCNAQQLSQVFLNLVVNAAQAIGDNAGTITLRTLERDNKVVVQIQDTGCGMPPEVKARIFEAFFTTKGAEQGTGLGLSITHDIVKKHGGEILVDSEVGKGTTFSVVLPIENTPA